MCQGDITDDEGWKGHSGNSGKRKKEQESQEKYCGDKIEMIFCFNESWGKGRNQDSQVSDF